MTTGLILLNVTCVSFFLLSFIAFFNPLKVNLIANRWFAVFLFSLGSATLDVIINATNTVDEHYRMIAFDELSRFALMPALYLSVLHYTSPDKVFRKREYLHLLPFLIFFICASPFVITPRWTFFNPGVFPSIFKTVLQLFIKLSIPLQMVIYWLLSYNKLVRHAKNIQLVASNTQTINLRWLKFILFGILLMIIVNLTDRIYGH